ADLVIQMLETDYARILRAIYAFGRGASRYPLAAFRTPSG
ncbi:hypothetical protein AALP_AAs60129U000100, partial [Arabis alpina]